MELASYYAAHHMIGEIDGRATSRDNALYLLDGTLRVIGAVTPMGEAPIGADFFALYPAECSEREALAERLAEYLQSNFLLLCTDIPVLAMSGLFLKSGLLPVMIPSGKVQKALSTPALFDRVPENLRISRGGLSRYRVPTDEERDAVGRWYASVNLPFSYGTGVTDGEAALRVMSTRAAHLARLCGCHMAYDLTGLGMRPWDVFDIDLYTSVLLAAMMATHRIGQGQTLRMFARREYGIGPVMYLEMHRTDAADTLPELLPLVRVAEARGAVFDCVCFADDPERVEIRASISPVELSRQGVKEPSSFTKGHSIFDLIPGEIFIGDEA